jgi:uncharacterized protein (DUF2062 family)
MTWTWFTSTVAPVWKPLLLGCFVMGTLTALTGYLVLSAFWRLSLVLRYHRRKGGGPPRDSATAEK